MNPSIEDNGDGALFTRGVLTIDRKSDAGAFQDALAWQALFERGRFTAPVAVAGSALAQRGAEPTDPSFHKATVSQPGSITA